MFPIIFTQVNTLFQIICVEFYLATFTSPVDLSQGKYMLSSMMAVWSIYKFVCFDSVSTTSLNFTFRCKSQKCPTLKIREVQKTTLTFLNLSYIFWRSFTFFMLVWSAWTGPPAPACKLALAGTPPQLASLHWLGHLPSLASPVATLLYKFYVNQALLSRATAVAGHCPGSLFP